MTASIIRTPRRRSIVQCLFASRASVAGLVVCSAWVALAPREAAAQPIVVFGDSLSDTGNILAFSSTPEAALLGFSPRPTSPWYSPGQFINGPAGNAGLPATAYTQGSWVNVLADRLGRSRPAAAGLAPDVLPLGTNFAWGGALASPASALPSASLQVELYINGRATVPGGALYTFWLGGNDLIGAASAPGATPASIAAAGSTAINALRASIQTLITALPSPGAAQSSTILWANLPALERTPIGLSLPAAARAALGQASLDFRAAQLAAIAELRAANTSQQPTLNLVSLDVYSIFNQVLDNPGAAGITNTTTPILVGPDFTEPAFVPVLNVPLTTNPDQYVFWDTLHPTARMHALLGEAAAMVVPGPGVAAAMGLCGVWVGVRRRRRNRQFENGRMAD